MSAATAATGAYAMPANQSAPRVVDDHAGEAERTYSLFNHLVGLLSLFDFAVLGLIGTAIMWRVKHDESPFLDDHGREAVNFQISLLVFSVAFIVFCIVTFGFGAVLTPVFIAAMIALRLVGCIRGSMAAHRGEFYRYPMCIRFIQPPVKAA